MTELAYTHTAVALMSPVCSGSCQALYYYYYYYYYYYFYYY